MPILTNSTEKQYRFSIDEVRTEVTTRLRLLLPRLGSRSFAIAELNDIRDILNSLPLDSEDFGVAVNRLRNCYRYLCSNESGAARYELKLLLGNV